ncbi:glycosyltransferase [Pontivivens ytuae]|uniref:Glycosyltransferase n=1 Tax=Pontivivens ytuae TaxID=2789856 RepID=A0A7S9LVF9_9RHOB|nr:glycosyltransferase [Pontivivens ytuae]QPH55849.1 glycosyltransferase [Pontivivens ytuae]
MLHIDQSRAFARARDMRPTGIDRVERHLAQALASTSSVTGLVRSGGRVWHGPVDELFEVVDSADVLDLAALATPWRDATRRRRETALRQRFGRGGRLADGFERGATYFAAGHNLPTYREMAVLREASVRLAILVHDIIPLTHPKLSRTAPAARFQERMTGVARHADVILHLSDVGREKWRTAFGPPPPGQMHDVLKLGPTGAPPLTRAPSERPEFLALSTIEPRKGHDLLLDLWEQFPEPPRLHLVGRRGWHDAAFFRRLDAAVASGAVIEHPDLDDAGVRALMARCRALLFPSVAEGYGLPVAEALTANLPVIASDLPELREIHGERVRYVTVSDREAWMLAISPFLCDRLVAGGGAPDLPSWDEVALQVRAIM